MPDGLTVLLTLYAGVRPDHLQAALTSVAAQTRTPDAMVVVVDGPVPAALEEVLAGFAPDFPVETVRLPVNQGSGPASAAGMEHVRTPWVARADADDVSLPTRLATQEAAVVRAAADGSPVDVVGAAMVEFVDDPDHPVGVRRLPSTHEAIGAYLRINNPVNNPTLLVRTQALRDAGGYRDVPLMEDYDLMARLWARGARFVNLDEPLVAFRMSQETMRRRTGARVLRGEWQMQRNLVAYGVTAPWQRWRNLVLRVGYRLLPAQAMSRAYSFLFRR